LITKFQELGDVVVFTTATKEFVGDVSDDGLKKISNHEQKLS